MTEQEILFISIGQRIPDSSQSQLFGKPCFKINQKAFICFFQHEMVFKLKGEIHREALGMDGSQLFDPSGKKRAMKEWVQVSFKNKDTWETFALAAHHYVRSKK